MATSKVGVALTLNTKIDFNFGTKMPTLHGYVKPINSPFECSPILVRYEIERKLERYFL